MSQPIRRISSVLHLRETRWRAVGWVTFALVGLALQSYFIPHQVDDAFITYRFVNNILSGHGPAYNPGGEFVEGFSSPFWCLVLIAGAGLFQAESLPMMAMLLGMASYLGLIGFAAWSDRTRSISALLVVPVLASVPGLVFYSVTGLEQVFFVLICVLGVSAMVQNQKNRLTWVLFLVAPWTRPEAPMILVIGSLVVLAGRPMGDWRRVSTHLGWYAIPFGTSFVLLLVIRWLLFEDFLPNTFYAKEPVAAAGLDYALTYLRQPWFVFSLALGCLNLLARSAVGVQMTAAGLLFLLTAVLEGGDWMPLGRFFLPGLSLVLIAGVHTRLDGNPKLLVTAGLLSVWGFSANGVAIDQVRRRIDAYQDTDLKLIEMTMSWVASQEVESVAMLDIGRFGFYLPDLRIVDLAGLTDKQIAKTDGGHAQHVIDATYLQRTDPDLVLLKVVEIQQIRPKFVFGASQTERHLMHNAYVFFAYEPLLLIAKGGVENPLGGFLVLKRKGRAVDVSVFEKRPGFVKATPERPFAVFYSGGGHEQ